MKNFVKIGRTEKPMDDGLHDLVLAALAKKEIMRKHEKELDKIEGQITEHLEDYRGKSRSCRLYVGGKECMGFSEEYGNDRIKDFGALKPLLGERHEDLVGVSVKKYPLAKLKKLARGELKDDPLAASADRIADCLEIKDDRPCLSYKKE
ncbi:MAG: hypothetical protein GY749_40305 [Desulfobacteraceae bacterium]|nr:hypothetical protein [Desulfobacteraceae bacterium]